MKNWFKSILKVTIARCFGLSFLMVFFAFVYNFLVESLEKPLEEYILYKMRIGAPIHPSSAIWDNAEKKVSFESYSLLALFASIYC